MNFQLLLLHISALRIHLSEEAQTAIRQFPGYEVDLRGSTYVKVTFTITALRDLKLGFGSLVTILSLNINCSH